MTEPREVCRHSLSRCCGDGPLLFAVPTEGRERSLGSERTSELADVGTDLRWATKQFIYSRADATETGSSGSHANMLVKTNEK